MLSKDDVNKKRERRLNWERQERLDRMNEMQRSMEQVAPLEDYQFLLTAYKGDRRNLKKLNKKVKRSIKELKTLPCTSDVASVIWRRLSELQAFQKNLELEISLT